MIILVEVRAYIPSELNDNIIKRSVELDISKSEYLRTLVTLDVSVQKYQELVTYINLLYGKINDTHQKLGIYATPLQDVPIININ